jgi:flagellar basal body rod protein FlgF
MIEASQRMIREQNNIAVNRHFELEIKTLQNAPRDADKLEQLLRLKERQKDEAMHIEDTHKG